MAKGSNNVKPKRSHLYKPYDSANSSLVSRLTNRVSEILPQPSSWLSRWLAPGEQSTFNQNDSENEEDDAVQQPPPSKKMRRSNDVTIRLNQNHAYPKIDNEPELSPILRNRSDQTDGAIPGPSGLHLRGVNFVASTPAVPIASAPNDHAGKINGGDEGSDGSESTSGCSSLVPQRESALAAPYKASIKKIPETPKLSRNSLGLDNRLSQKSKLHTLDTSMPLYRNRSSFDAYAFNNPLNKSLTFNSTLNKTHEDSFNSPFYRGRTMYGGNSSCKESLSLSLTSPKVGTPKIVSVRPTPNLTQSRETISTSALKILRAIEQFSSPVTDAKKIPLRTESERRKRKAMQPFEDLVIPTMPDLLRIKRRQRVISESSSASTSTTSSVMTPKPYQLPPPVQQPTTREDVTEPKRVMKGKHIEEMKAERVDKVDLPSIPLPLTSLPSFTLNSLPPTLSAPPTPAPRVTCAVSLPSASAALPTFKFSNAFDTKPISPKFTFSSPIVEKRDDSSIVAVKSTLKFRAPLEADSSPSAATKEDTKGSNCNALQSKVDCLPVANDLSRSNFNFTPTQTSPNFKKSEEQKEKLGSVPSFFNQDKNSDGVKSPVANDSSSRSKLNFLPPPSSQFTPKLKKPVEQQESVPILKTSVNDKLGSVSSFFNKDKKSEEVKSDSDSLAKFKAPSGSWTCSSCLVPNKEESSKCCCCETLKPGNKEVPKPQTLNALPSKSEKTWLCNQCSFKNNETVEVCVCGLKRGEKSQIQPLSKSFKDLTKQSSDSWECKECFVRNKSSDKACAACSVPQPGAAKIDAPLPLSATFKMPEGTWECPTCMVGNKSSSTKCVACETLRPGATPAPKTTPKFSFGIPNVSAPSAAPLASSAPFTFTIPSSSSEKNSGTTEKGGFTFGIPVSQKKSVDETKEDLSNKNTSASKMATKVADEETETVPPKKANLGEFLSNDKKSAEGAKQNQALFTFGGASTVKITEPSSTFLLSGTGTKRSPFGSTSVVSSSSTDAKSSPEPFKFGSSSTGVSSSTDPATTKASGLASKTEGAAPTFNIFGDKTTFPAPEKKQETVFGGMPSNPLFASANSVDKPAFGMSGTTATANVDTSKNALANNLFASNENKPVFGQSNTTDQPASSFFNSTENKGSFFNSEASDNKSIFGGAATTDKWNKPSFGSTSNSLFDLKPTAPVNNTSNAFAPPSAASNATVFGSQTAMLNPAESKPTTFGALQNAPNPTEPFTFKGLESTSNSNRSTFSFGAPAPVSLANNAFNFNSESTFSAPQQNSLGLGNAQPPTFGAPTTNPTPHFNNPASTPAPSPFAFGSQQQDQPQQFQSTFGFSAAQPQVAAAPFSFNVANSTPAPTPTFDPNIKPSFNFTGGAPTPTFSAPPQPQATGEKPAERKIRRAIRRTQQR